MKINSLFKKKCEYYLCDNKWNSVIYPLLNGKEYPLRICIECYKEYKEVK